MARALRSACFALGRGYSRERERSGKVALPSYSPSLTMSERELTMGPMGGTPGPPREGKRTI